MPTSQHKPRILIVDDIPTNIHTLIEALQDSYTLMIANGGAKALELALSDTPPELVLLDVMMPEIDGYAVIERLKSDERTRHIPVIFVTSRDEVIDETKGFKLGAADYITKPISPLIVHARIKVHLDLYRQKIELEKTVKILERKLALISPPKTLKQPEKRAESLPGRENEEYFLDDHRGDLQEIEDELDATINLMLLQRKINPELMHKSSQLFERYANILSLYPIFLRFGGGMYDFAQALRKQQHQPTEENNRFALGCLESLIYTLRHWSIQIFEGLLENPNVFDNSMLSDMETILNALENKMEDTTGQIEFFKTQDIEGVTMPDTARQHILIVDDMPTNIHSLIEILQEHYTLMVANSGAKALELCDSSTPPELILLDVMMPDMDGYEVIKHLKSNPKTQEIPVIFVTAMGEAVDEVYGLNEGAADYLAKPINSAVVLARVKTHLELYKHKRNLIKLVEEKTEALVTLNQNLEKQVFEKTEENLAKSKIIQDQARFIQMGELLGMITHQWRQPLSIVSMSVGCIKDMIHSDYSEEELDRILCQAMDTLQQLSKTIQDFSGYFRPDEFPKEIFLQELIKETISIMEPILSEGDIQIKLDMQACEQQIFTYQNALREIILKLLQNSKEAFERTDTLNPSISISTRCSHNKAQIVIVDNGGGISEEIIHKVFDPYFSTKTQLQKFGLGLYSAKSVIESYCEGSLEIENSSSGVQATISLPFSVTLSEEQKEKQHALFC